MPIGPYNQAVIADNLIFTSGQIPVDAATNQLVAGGIKEQTEVVLNNLKGLLEGAGSSLEHVVKTTVFLKNMNDFSGMNEVYGKYFTTPTAPARSTVEAARLPKDVLIEIEAVAALEK